LFLTTLFFCCLTVMPAEVSPSSSDRADAAANHSEGTTEAKAVESKLPEAPTAKSESASNESWSSSLAPENISPASEALRKAPVKPAARGSYETDRQRKIWYGLVAAGHSSAVFDAYTTRRAISGGYGTESDPLLRPFAHSNAMYLATQVSPAVMDYLGHRMMSSGHSWVRRLWWVPQVAGTGMSLSAGIHNYRIVP
jgi:hypothetical protein